MKNNLMLSRLAVASLSLGLFAVETTVAPAATAAAVKTNWVQNFNFKLSGWAPDQSKPTAISSKDVVSALSGATVQQMSPPSYPGGPPHTNVVTLPTFAGTEKLLTLQSVLSTNPPQVLVRKGSGKSQTDYDVSSAFVPAADTPNNPPITFVSAGLTNYHSITTFAFAGKTNVLSFVLSGFMAASDTKVKIGSATYTASKGLTATVAGTGAIGTTTNVFGGTVSMAGGHLE
ncbi:MAG: hypothetical protein ABSF95_18805 [Verrucomicrobiota bacterium]|jgi:hypothetical protein